MTTHAMRQRRLRPGMRPRRGSALVLVLVAMVVLLLLSSGVMFGSMQELRSSRNIAVQQRAQAVAEFGMNAQLQSWPSSRNAMANGAIDSTVVAVATGDTARVRVQRLNAKIFNVVSIGRASIGNGRLEAQRQTSLLVRVSAPSIGPLGLLSVREELEVKGSPVLDGRNTPPPGWNSCSGFPTTDTTAVAYNPAFPPDIQKANQTVGGTRALPAAADTATYSVFGAETWSTLAGKANVSISGGNSTNPSPTGSATSCTVTSSNWGEPSRGSGSVAGCQNYFPIIYSSGDLDLQNGRGQGILLVNGRLRITGNFLFAGIILVRDELEVMGTPSLYGSIRVRAADDSRSRIQGNANLFFSHCATGQALAGLATPRRSAQRSWAPIY